MRFTSPLLPLALAAMLAAAPAAAQEVTEADRAAIAARIEKFDATARSGDLAALIAFTPPRVREHIAAAAGVPADALEDALRQQLGPALQGVVIDDFGMDLAGATFATTPDGSRTYGLIPTVTEMTVEGSGSMRATSSTVAIEDGGEWYLVRVDDPSQVAILTAVYPEFAGVAFEPGTLESLP